ncbi:MAG: type II secretion system protein [Candidatus Acidiferrales bacterium]
MSNRAQRGFTLIELLIGVAIFLIVASAAFSLFGQHVALIAKQQNMSAVNIGLRNAMSQLQMDLADSGQNLVNSVPSAGQYFSLGDVIQNNVPGAAGISDCTPDPATWAYPVAAGGTESACFDSLEIINPKLCAGCLPKSPFAPYVPVLQITDAGDLTSAGSAIQASDANADDSLITTPATLAANFTAGDELLLLIPKNPNLVGGVPHCSGNTAPPYPGSAFPVSQSTFCMAVVTLTANATVSGTGIQLPSYTVTGASGQPSGCPGAGCSDPLGIVSDPSAPGTVNYAAALSPGPYGTSSGAFIINLGIGSNDIWYSVLQNASDPTDAQLMRCLGAPCTAANAQALADQVVGFKVGAALWDQGASTDLGSYFYSAANYCSGYILTAVTPSVYYDCTAASPYSPPGTPNNDPDDFSLLRSVRISLIARTAPKVDPTLQGLQNGFDGGPYLVQQSSEVVDLRNMSDQDSNN